MNDWMTPPEPPIIIARSSPMLVASIQLVELTRYVREAGADIAQVDVSRVMDTSGLFDALRSAIPFPTWCGSG